MSSDSTSKDAARKPLTKEEVHRYAKVIMIAMDTPDFQARVREAMARPPVPNSTEDIMYRYEDVQADFFTNHFHPPTKKKTVTAAAAPAASATAEDSTNASPTQQPESMDAKTEEGALSAQVAAMTIQESPEEKLDGVYIMEQLRCAVGMYKDNETERIITQLCMLVEAKVTSLPATVPALKHLYVESVHGRDAASAAAAARASGENPMPIVDPSPQMMAMMEMAMKTLTPQQRATLERAQQTMMNGSPPSPDDMRDMFMIQRQLGAFMQTMQQFGQMPGGRGGARGRGRGGRGGRGK